VPAPAEVLADNLRFLRALVSRPKNIGAIVPSSRALARAIAAQIDPGRPGPVLELGPGTGVVTEALLERGLAGERLTLVEYDPDMAACLARRFERVQVIEGDAFDLGRTLGPSVQPSFSAIVSGLPLLNFPFHRRHGFVEAACRLLGPDAPLVQFSYGVNAPVSPPAGFAVKKTALVWANLPPARVWVYRKN
jgi:phosphatidylethanolamine/phosphatidyl-N-methylethanolamine N-methyltransferase